MTCLRIVWHALHTQEVFSSTAFILPRNFDMSIRCVISQLLRNLEFTVLRTDILPSATSASIFSISPGVNGLGSGSGPGFGSGS